MELISVIFVNCTSPPVPLLELGAGRDLPARRPCHTRGWEACNSDPGCAVDQILLNAGNRPALLGFECILESRVSAQNAHRGGGASEAE